MPQNPSNPSYPSNPSLPLSDVKGMIRGAGLRSTAARVAVIRHLASVPSPQTRAEVMGALVSVSFDQSAF